MRNFYTKKAFFSILATVLVMATGCGGGSKVTDATNEESNLGIWEVKYFVDDFGEPTKEGYITTKEPIRGTFSNDVSQNKSLNVVFIIASEKLVGMQLYQYDDMLFNTNLDVSYKVLVKDSKEEVHTLKAYHDYDKLVFYKAESEKLYNILLQGGTIKFNIVGTILINDSRSGEYNFTIDNADGFENAIIKLTGGSKEKDVSSTAKNEDFESFIKTFTSDKNFQLSRIKFPLRLVKSKDKWEFLGTNDIFEGVKKIKGNPLEGKFVKESDNKYRYTLYSVFEIETDNGYDYDGGELLFGLDFSKIDGEWMLTDIFNGDDE